jgi:hypothetical protein
MISVPIMMILIIDPECGILSDDDDEKLGYYYCVDLLLYVYFQVKSSE